MIFQQMRAKTHLHSHPMRNNLNTNNSISNNRKYLLSSKKTDNLEKENNQKLLHLILEGWKLMEISRQSKVDSNLRNLSRRSLNSIQSIILLPLVTIQNQSHKNNINSLKLKKKLVFPKLKWKYKSCPRKIRKRKNNNNLMQLWLFWEETKHKPQKEMNKRKRRKKKRNRKPRIKPNKNNKYLLRANLQ